MDLRRSGELRGSERHSDFRRYCPENTRNALKQESEDTLSRIRDFRVFRGQNFSRSSNRIVVISGYRGKSIMKQRLLFVFCLIVGANLAAFSQVKTVTNTDLERYRQDRLKAEAEYRENYKKLGFPSPEELDRRNARSANETIEMAARLRSERMTRERLDDAREVSEQREPDLYVEKGSGIYEQLLYPSYFRYRWPLIRQGYVQQGYFAAGQFWPTGPRTKPRPLWVRPQH